MRHSRFRRRRRGISLLEVLVATLLIALTSAGVCATWGMSLATAASKRRTEVALYVAGAELERLKSLGYARLEVTGEDTPNTSYRDGRGFPNSEPAPQGYVVRSWVTVQSDPDGVRNSDDLLRIRVEVSASEPAPPQVVARGEVLLAFGGH